MTTSVPAGLVLEQGPTARAMALGGLRSLVPARFRTGAGTRDEPRRATVSAGSDRNLDAYAAWSGAPPERYAQLVPPHSCSRWAMPMIARLTADAPYPLLKVVNQGVRLQVAAALPRGVPLHLEGRLVDGGERDGRVRIASRIVVSTDAHAAALTLDAVAAVVTGRRRERAPRQGPTRSWRAIGGWRADAADGARFFRLTGDFNPIHTLPLFARRTRFGGCILHGFGSFARTFEVVQNEVGAVRDLEVRFVAPVPLPSPELVVELADEVDPDGRRPLRLRGAGDTVHLVGAVVTEGPR